MKKALNDIEILTDRVFFRNAGSAPLILAAICAVIIVITAIMVARELKKRGKK